MPKNQGSKIAVPAKEARKFLRGHGFPDDHCVNQFLSKVHSNVVVEGRAGRVKIPDDLLWRNGIRIKLYAEISASGVLTAIKQ